MRGLDVAVAAAVVVVLFVVDDDVVVSASVAEHPKTSCRRPSWLRAGQSNIMQPRTKVQVKPGSVGEGGQSA